MPFVFLLLSAALRSMNPSLEEASNVSGASPLKTFLRVTLPVLRPGVLAPLVLGTLVTLEQFETPLVIGFPARINVFSTRIFFELNPDTDLPGLRPGRRRPPCRSSPPASCSCSSTTG